MNYQRKNKIGRWLEFAGALGTAVAVNYDSSLVYSIIPVGLFIYGMELRDVAVEDARLQGFAEGVDSVRELVRPDLSDSVADGENLPFGL